MERKIGEQFNDNGVELRVEEAPKTYPCTDCYYAPNTQCSYFYIKTIRGECVSRYRTENKDDVIFTEVTKTE